MPKALAARVGGYEAHAGQDACATQRARRRQRHVLLMPMNGLLSERKLIHRPAHWSDPVVALRRRVTRCITPRHAVRNSGTDAGRVTLASLGARIGCPARGWLRGLPVAERRSAPHRTPGAGRWQPLPYHPRAVPFFDRPWGRRGAAQPIPGTSHLVRGSFCQPFPWGRRGPGGAYLTRARQRRRAKALVTAI